MPIITTIVGYTCNNKSLGVVSNYCGLDEASPSARVGIIPPALSVPSNVVLSAPQPLLGMIATILGDWCSTKHCVEYSKQAIKARMVVDGGWW